MILTLFHIPWEHHIQGLQKCWYMQARGGRGVSGAHMRDDDTVEEVAHVMDHDTVLFFSPDGICRALKAYQIPQSSRTAAGTPLTQARALCCPHQHYC